MSAILKFTSAAIILGVVFSAPARGSDLTSGVTIKAVIRPPKSCKWPDRDRRFMQKSRDFYLMRDGKQVRPISVGLAYRKEVSEADRLLLSARSYGLEGWVSASAVVALTEAEPFFSRAIQADPGDWFAYLMRAIARMGNDDHDHAFADLNEALRLDPKNVPALVTRSILWWVKGRPEQALADVNKAIEIDARNSDALVDRGVLYASAKEYGKTLADFERAVKEGSQQAIIYYVRGLIDVEKRELDGARAEFERALQIDPERTDALQALGMVQMRNGEADEALSSLNKAIQINPKAGPAYGIRGMLFHDLSQDAKALADLNEAIRLEPEEVKHLHNRVLIMYSRAEFDRALADVEKAIQLDANDADPHQGRAWILMAYPVPRLRNGAEAVVSATRACELTNWRHQLHLATLAAAYSEAGDFTSAVKWQERAVANLDLRDAEAEVDRTLLVSYKNKHSYRTVGSWQGMWLRDESQQP
jgi:tetratricopeptide (TPR) repeat protein